MKVGVSVSPQWNENFGVRAGADVDIPIKGRWSFMPGVYWSLRSRDESEIHKEKEIDYKNKAHFITLPLRFGVKVAGRDDDKFLMKILFGPYVACGIDGTSKYESYENGQKVDAGEYGAFSSKGCYAERFDYGLNFGLHTVIKRHFTAGAFCEIGCRNIYQFNNEFYDILGDMFSFTKINLGVGLSVGYRF